MALAAAVGLSVAAGTVGASGAAAAVEPSNAPATVPALQSWAPHPGSFAWTAHSRVVVRSAGLRADAQVFATDLSRALGRRVPVVTAGRTRPGDIGLRLDRTVRPAAEGYRLRVGASIEVAAATTTGAFWGTRSVLQLLHHSVRVPAGVATDHPLYPQRGVLLSAEVKFYTVSFITRLIRSMAYLKLNQLTLQETVPVPSHPELNRYFPRLTPAQLRQITACARQYHVRVLLSTGFPGHADPYYRFEPRLALKDAAGNPRPLDLDIGNPATYDFVRDVLDTYVPADPGPGFLAGGDEYLGDRAAYENYPSLVAWAKKHVGSTAPASDAYRYWITWMNRQVRSHGRTMYLWNDELWRDSLLPLPANIVVNYWVNYPDRLSVRELVDNGNRLLNSDISLYYSYPDDIPDAAGAYQGFAPNVFDGGQVLPVGDPHVLGASMSIWPDEITADDEEKVEPGIAPIMSVLAAKTWSAAAALPADYPAFQRAAAAVGPAPQPDPAGPLAPNRVYRLRNAGTGRFLAAAAPGSALVQTTADTPAAGWLATEDAFGAYSLVSARTGECAQVGGDPGQVGAAVVTAPCDAAVPQQRFQLEPAGTGYALRSQSTGQAVAAAGRSAVVQAGEPGPAATNWRLQPVPAGRQATIGLSGTTTTYARAGGTVTVRAEARNWSGGTATGLRAALRLPAGRTATPAARRALPPIAAGAGRALGWTVHVPAGAEDGVVSLPVVLDRGSGLIAGSSIPVTVAGPRLAASQALVANLDDASVSPVDLGTGVAGRPIGVGARPGVIATSADGRTAYVPNQRAASVSVVDTRSGAVTATIAVGAIPVGAALTPDGKTLWVGDYGDNAVQPVDVATHAVGAEIPIGPNPEDMAVSPDGKTLWVANLGGTVNTVDLATRTAGTPITLAGGPDGLLISPDGRTVYIGLSTGSTVTPIDAATRKPGRPIEVGSGPFHLTPSPDGHTVAVAVANTGEVVFFDRTTGSVTGRVRVGPAPISVAYSRSGRLAFVTDSGNGTVLPIDTGRRVTGAPIAVGRTPVWVSIVPGRDAAAARAAARPRAGR